jgi:sugar lactone lactonase YvrE
VEKKPFWFFTAIFLAALLRHASPIAARGADLYIGDNSPAGKIYKFSDSGVRSVLDNSSISPTGLAFDANGNLFAATHDPSQGVIYKYTPAGTRSTFASGLSLPEGLAFDANGNLFEADDVSGTIFKFTPSGIKTSFATGLVIPVGLAFDASGNLFVSSEGPGIIFVFTPGGVKSTFASGLSGPIGLAFDAQGNLFVADSNNSGGAHIFRYTPGGVQSTFWSGFGEPVGLAFDASGNLFESDTLNRAVYKFDPQGNRSTFDISISLPEWMAFAPLPEPSTFVLAAAGSIAVLIAGRRRLLIARPTHPSSIGCITRVNVFAEL